MEYEHVIKVPRLGAQTDRLNPTLFLQLVTEEGFIFYMLEWCPIKRLALILNLNQGIPVFAFYDEIRDWQVQEGFVSITQKEIVAKHRKSG